MYTAARQGFNAYKSFTRTGVKKRNLISGIGVTSQHDSRLVYRKKRMPRRKRKAWTKFSRKVHAVFEKQLGTKTIVFNDSVSVSPASTAVQTWNLYLLYGKNGDVAASSAIGIADLQGLVQRLSGSTSLTTTSNEKYKLSTAVLDTTYTNTDSLGKSIELDIYEVYFRKEVSDSTPGRTMTTAESATGTVTTGTSLTMTSRGVTPFDLPLFISQTGMVITKKTKYFLGAGNSITYQIRDTKNRTVTKYDILDYGVGSDDNAIHAGSWIQPNMTKGVFAVWKTVAGVTGNGTLSVGATRKYKAVQLDLATVQDSYG